MKASVDFETYSEVDLKASGAFRYAEDPSTEPLIIAYSIGDRPALGVDLTQDWDMVIRLLSPLFDYIDKGGIICAHNAQFERLIWEKTAIGRRFPIRPKPRAWDCTAARARMLAIPGSLDGAANALGINIRKDPRGKALIDMFSKPQRKRAKGNETTWRIRPEDNPDAFEEFIQYCEQDVEVEKKLDRVLPPLDEVEADAFRLDYRINDRGMPVNMELVDRAADFVDTYSDQLMKKAVEISGCRPTQREKTMEFLKSRGYEVPNLQAPTVETLAKRKGLPKDLVELLDLRIELSRAGTKKLRAIKDTVSPDGRIRGGFLFSAASTRRWSSTGVQMHNLQKPEGETNPEAVLRLLATDPMLLLDLFDRPLTALAQSIRGFFEAPEGKVFHIADYSSVEPRGLAWMADEEWILEAYREKKDLYRVTAGKVYGKDPEQLTKDGPERFMGKQLVLGCFAADTKVFTDRGWTDIVSVRRDDLVWDGEQWVTQTGPIFQGEKPTISLCGVQVTPEHKVWNGSHWLTAQEVADDPSSRKQAIGWASSSLSRLSGSDPREELLSSKPSATAEDPASFGRRTAQRLGLVRDVLLKGLLLGDGRGMSPSPAGNLGNLYPMTTRRLGGSGGICSTGSMDLLGQEDPEISTKRTISASAIVGWSSRIFWPMWSSLKGGGNTRSSTDGTTWGITPPRTVGSSTTEPVIGTARSESGRPTQPVYDLTNCGPRNRFMIWTNEGPMVVHNCGYGMGPPRFIETVAKFGRLLTEEESRKAVYGYRNSVPMITKFWRTIESACIKATREWKTLRVGRLQFRPATLSNGFRVLFVDMPSGTIAYPKPSVGQEMWAGAPRSKFEFWTPLGQHWVKTDTFGGSLTENVIQALCRDVLRDGLLAADRAGFKVIGHVHDEGISEGEDNQKDLLEFQHYLSNSSPWAKGFPLETEAFNARRYRK